MFALRWFGTEVETSGGTLLLLGLFAQRVASLLSGQTAVADRMFHALRNH